MSSLIRKFQFVLILFSALLIPATQAKVCFPLSYKSRVFDAASNIHVNPNGRYALYWQDDKTEKVSRLLLADEKTEKHLELTSKAYQKESFWRRASAYFNFWGFSDGGTLAYVLKGEDLKIHDLSNGSEFTAKVSVNGEIWRLSVQDNFQARILEEVPVKAKSDENKEGKLVYFRILDLKTGRESRHLIPGFQRGCQFVMKDLSKIFFANEKGALYQVHLTEDTPLEPIQLFGPVDGFDQLNEDLELKCRTALEGTRVINFLKAPVENGFRLRLPTEQRDFLIPMDWIERGESEEEDTQNSWIVERPNRNPLFEGDLFLWLENVQFPFFLNHFRLNGPPRPFYFASKIGSAYHIPSGQKVYSDGDEEDQYISRYSSSEIYRKGYRDNGEDRIQFLFNPFDPSRRKVLLDWNQKEIEKERWISVFLPGKGTITGTLIKNIFGEMVIVSDEKAQEIMTRVFIPSPFEDFFNADVFISESEILLFREVNTGGVDFLPMNEAHQWEMRCAEPVVDFQKAAVSFQLSDAKDQESLLSLLAYAVNHPQVIQKHPELMQDILWRALLMSPALYTHLQRLYPFFGDLPPSDSLPDFISERKDEALASLKSVLKLTVNSDYLTRLSDWRFLRQVRPLLWELSPEDQSFYRENITLSVMNGAVRMIPPLEDVFRSKLFYLIHPHVQELFGEERQAVSDITVARNRQGFQILILSSDAIEESGGLPDISTDFGLHYVVVKSTEEDSLKDVKDGVVLADDLIRWRVDGQDYRSKVDVKANFEQGRDVDDLIPALKSPDYESIWQDKKMVGLMAVGSGMRHLSQYLAEEYIAYLEGEGFQFEGLETGNLKKFFLEKVKNCELDYFIKHGHGAGDERNIMRLDLFNYVVQASRIDENSGRAEEIYLVFPPFPVNDEDRKERFMLTTSDMAWAMRERERKGCGQFTMLNVTCWSAGKAVYESGAIRSPGFLNIPTRSPAEAFEDRGRQRTPRPV